MTLALGIDGGGTNTRALVIDEKGQVVGYGMGGASKPDAVSPETGRANLQTAVRAACASLGGVNTLDSVFVGMGGVVSAEDIQVVRSMLDGLELRPEIPVEIDLDIRVSLAGGLAEKPGIALIVGTGTSCYGRNAAGESWRAGGWGYIIDDAGSGFYLGQQILMSAVRMADKRIRETELLAAVKKHLAMDDINAIMHYLYHPQLNYAGIASLARLALELAETEPVTRLIVEHGCTELGHMVMVTARELHLKDDVPVTPSGGLVESSAFYRGILEKAIKRSLRAAYLVTPLSPPIVGAAFLALKQVGVQLPEAQLTQIAKQLKS